MTRAKQRSRS